MSFIWIRPKILSQNDICVVSCIFLTMLIFSEWSQFSYKMGKYRRNVIIRARGQIGLFNWNRVKNNLTLYQGYITAQETISFNRNVWSDMWRHGQGNWKEFGAIHDYFNIVNTIKPMLLHKKFLYRMSY